LHDREHIARQEKYRRYTNAANGNKRHFSARWPVPLPQTKRWIFALQNGLFVIVQFGEVFEIVLPPDSFTAKEW